MQPTKLDKQSFLELIHDFENLRQWVYKGNKPAIIHFTAEWCAPCNEMRERLQKLAVEYNGAVEFYEVNVDEEEELAIEFGIVNIPSVLFIPEHGEPMMQPGPVAEQVLKGVIDKVLLELFRSAG